MSSIVTVDSEAIANLRALSPDDGDVFLKEILSIFLEDTPSRIAELHNSRASANVTSFVRAAHSIKGSSSNVGASELRSVAERLEHQARTYGLSEVDAQVAELEASFLRAKDALQKLITN
ncbi:Hpt domain-containing protein [Rariglobus hedericola]|uniref:Hpt domain-containing protein n=1 Tax=Rariglobus hedericola TaxID=2597822 RepID=A0A556QNZ9_9BACT|nr:Hpt domain-containing protein [Rariglobus hedericola]TSJ78361.1 Hpt domain-containing protein [Rariglobus hedericola]